MLYKKIIYFNYQLRASLYLKNVCVCEVVQEMSEKDVSVNHVVCNFICGPPPLFTIIHLSTCYPLNYIFLI